MERRIHVIAMEKVLPETFGQKRSFSHEQQTDGAPKKLHVIVLAKDSAALKDAVAEAAVISIQLEICIVIPVEVRPLLEAAILDAGFLKAGPGKFDTPRLKIALASFLGDEPGECNYLEHFKIESPEPLNTNGDEPSRLLAIFVFCCVLAVIIFGRLILEERKLIISFDSWPGNRVLSQLCERPDQSFICRNEQNIENRINALARDEVDVITASPYQVARLSPTLLREVVPVWVTSRSLGAHAAFAVENSQGELKKDIYPSSTPLAVYLDEIQEIGDLTKPASVFDCTMGVKEIGSELAVNYDQDLCNEDLAFFALEEPYLSAFLVKFPSAQPLYTSLSRPGWIVNMMIIKRSTFAKSRRELLNFYTAYNKEFSANSTLSMNSAVQLLSLADNIYFFTDSPEGTTSWPTARDILKQVGGKVSGQGDGLDLTALADTREFLFQVTRAASLQQVKSEVISPRDPQQVELSKRMWNGDVTCLGGGATGGPWGTDSESISTLKLLLEADARWKACICAGSLETDAQSNLQDRLHDLERSWPQRLSTHCTFDVKCSQVAPYSLYFTRGECT